jgi:hypothetical protein
MVLAPMVVAPMIAQARALGKVLAREAFMYNACAMKRAPAKKRTPATVAAPPASRAGARVVSLLDPEIVLERAAKRFLAQPLDRCVKCHSTFIGHEPAFIHCYYCGKMARIANASLLLQEEFEMRSGMRAAS